MKKLIALAAIFLLFSSTAYAQLGVDSGWARSFIRANGETIADLSSPTGGFTLSFGFDEEEDGLGNITKPGTVGMEFSASYARDLGIDNSTVQAGAWKQVKKVRFVGGLQGDFLRIGDNETKISEDTEMGGFFASIKFKAQGLPAIASAAYTWSWSGEDIEKLDLSLGLMTSKLLP